MLGGIAASVAGPAAVVRAQGNAQAPGLSDRPVRLVVPFAPGGGDTLARLAAQAAQAALGQPLVVENRSGAGGNVGAEAVARAPADGHTLLYGTNGTRGINEALYPRLPFQPDADFAPVAALTRITLVLVVRNDLPVDSGPRLVAHLKAHPGKLTYASARNGTTGRIAAEMFRAAAGVEVVHVPYRGNAAAMSDLAAGRVDMAIELIPAAFPLVQGGSARALAVTRWTDGGGAAGAAPPLSRAPRAGAPGIRAAARWRRHRGGRAPAKRRRRR